MVLPMAVVGAGRAGRARVKAIQADPRAELAGLVRREPEPGERTFEQLLADDAVRAVVVCTPNVLHPATIRAALEAGKHVAVEFPIAPNVSIASELFDLARAQDRVLHVEHIELISPSQHALRDSASKLGRPRSGEVHFTSGSDGWIGDPALAGSPSLRTVARLHRIVDLFGPATIQGASLLRGSAGAYSLRAEIGFEQGGALTLVEERGPRLDRGTAWSVQCEDGELTTPDTGPPGALFQADHHVFVDRILNEAESYVSEERILHVLGLVEQLEAASCA